MNLQAMQTLLQAELLTKTLDISREIGSVCGADLMSDVLTYTKANTLLLTGLTSIQVVRTAEMLDLVGIVFVRGKRPTQEVIHLAEQNDLPLFCTAYPLYEAAGILYSAGLKGCSQIEEGE